MSENIDKFRDNYKNIEGRQHRDVKNPALMPVEMYDRVFPSISQNSGQYPEQLKRYYEDMRRKIRGEDGVDVKEHGLNGIAINVVTWADLDKRTGVCWGDYWVKWQLMDELAKLGIKTDVGQEAADVTIYLWGSPFPFRKRAPHLYNPRSFNVAWQYSHPDKICRDEMMKYNLIFCLSKYYLKNLEMMNLKERLYQEPLLSCTNMRPPLDAPVSNVEIAFIGNARGGKKCGREIIGMLDHSWPVKLWGHKWHMSQYVYNRSWYSGQYMNYHDLPRLYNGAKIVLNDTHPDMAREGYVPMKIFDILGSGGFCISDHVRGMKDIFDDAVPMYSSANELNELVAFFMNNEKAREEKTQVGMAIAHQHSYEDRIVTILDGIKEHV